MGQKLQHWQLPWNDSNNDALIREMKQNSNVYKCTYCTCDCVKHDNNQWMVSWIV